MSILIKGMEMPNTGMCKTITIFDNGVVVEGNGSEKLGIAVPVQPHGRLVDADANLSVMRRVLDNPYIGHGKIDTAMLKAYITMFEEAPTVLETEEE